MVKSLPRYPNLSYSKKQAKRLLKAIHQRDAAALARVQRWHPRYGDESSGVKTPSHFILADAQLVIAREHGFSSWAHYKKGILMARQTLFDTAIQAVITGDTAKLRQLLRDHPELSTAQSAVNGATLLHYVSANGVEDHYQKTPPNAVAVVLVLFNAGADPNVTADFYGGGAGSTPLVGLVSSAHPHQAGVQVDLIHTYIQQGAKPNGIADDGRPASTALEHWYPQAFAALVENGARLDNLVYAAAAGAVQRVQTMLEEITLAAYVDAAGKAITDGDAIRARAFVKACLCGQQATAEQLHATGVDVNSTLEHARTALHEAAWSGQTEVIAWLLANGADPSLRDTQFGSMAVQWAYVAGHTDAFDLLVPHSPLTVSLAAQFGLRERVAELLDAHPERIDENGGAPLRAAVSYRQTAVVELLLQRGAAVNLTNANGDSARDLAQRMGYDDIVALLDAHQA